MAAHKIKTFLALLLLLLIPLLSSSDMVEGFKVDSMHPRVYKDIGVGLMNNRKLIMTLDQAVLDYDDAGANPKHDPRKKIGGKP